MPPHKSLPIQPYSIKIWLLMLIPGSTVEDCDMAGGMNPCYPQYVDRYCTDVPTTVTWFTCKGTSHVILNMQFWNVHWKKWSQNGSTEELFGKTVRVLESGAIFFLIIMKRVPLCKEAPKWYLKGGHLVDREMVPLWSHFGSTFFFLCILCSCNLI